jgi:hypothetical protein
MDSIDPIACAAFLIAAFVLAGFAQVAWMALPWSHRFAMPLDGGRTFRGRRIFGANKTLRGFLVMVPAAALSFVAVRHVFAHGDAIAVGLWPLTSSGYALLGAWAGFGFMVGELPNSFVKRQLGIAPGAAAGRRAAWLSQLVADRVDSGIGMLSFTSLAVPTPWLTWFVVLTAGPAIHWSFSALMFWLGTKPRIA